MYAQTPVMGHQIFRLAFAAIYFFVIDALFSVLVSSDWRYKVVLAEVSSVV